MASVGPRSVACPLGEARRYLSRANRSHRKFWRDCLPRLKYWNPSIPMIVQRTADATAPATLTIYFRNAAASASATDAQAPTQGSNNPSPTSGLIRSPEPHTSAAAPPPAEDETVVSLSITKHDEPEILAEFLAKTRAVVVQPTAAEEQEMRDRDERVAANAAERARNAQKQRKKERRRLLELEKSGRGQEPLLDEPM